MRGVPGPVIDVIAEAIVGALALRRGLCNDELTIGVPGVFFPQCRSVQVHQLVLPVFL